jgi:transcriptional regulator with XRE-family HTH domain
MKKLAKEKALLKKLGNKIRELRASVGLSQEELAEKVGIHRTYIGSVERGERNVSIINMFYIARSLNSSLSELFESINEQ